jgi:hypothetical protein
MTWGPDQLHERFINPVCERTPWHPCQKQTKNGQYNLKNHCACERRCGRNRLSVSVSVHFTNVYSDFFFTNTHILSPTHTISVSRSLAPSLSRVRSIFTCIPHDHDPVLDSMPSNAHITEEMRRDSLAISKSDPRGSGDNARSSRYHNPPPSNGRCGSLKVRWRDGGTENVIQGGLWSVKEGGEVSGGAEGTGNRHSERNVCVSVCDTRVQVLLVCSVDLRAWVSVKVGVLRSTVSQRQSDCSTRLICKPRPRPA